MLDEKQLRRRVLLRFVGSPLVLAPFVAGLTVFAGLWAFGSRLGLGLFAGVAGLLTSVGVYLTRALLDDGRTSRAVLAEMEQEFRQARQSALDDLDRRHVHADKDPRPELALRDLRALQLAFEALATRTGSVHLPTLLEVRGRVDQLFDQAVRSLEQTFTLGETARQLQTAPAREPILQQRERILEEVRVTVRQLGDTLAAVQRFEGDGSTGAALARLREELDESLRVANRVEARLDTLLDRPSIENRNPSLPNPQEKG